MKNICKKWFALALAVCMGLSASACGKKDTSSSGSDEVLGYDVVESGKSASVPDNADMDTDKNLGLLIDKSSKGAKVVNNCYETGYPIAKDKVKFKIMLVDHVNGADLSKRAFTKYISQKFNIDLEYELVSSAQVSEKVTLAFASGNLPDMFWGMALYGDVSKLNSYVKDNALYSFDDYKAYAPNIYKMLDKYKDARYLCTSDDGKMYTIPLVREDQETLYRDKFYINKTWLKKLGLSMPKTLNDLTAVLRAFKNNDPNGNGKKDEIPMMFVNEIPTSWYGIFGVSTYNYFTRTAGNQILNVNLMNEYKTALKTLSDYYSEGLLYNYEIRNINSTKAMSMLNASVKTVGIVNANNYSSVMSAETFLNDYTMMPLIDETGNGTNVASYMDVEQMWSLFCMIPKKCKYPEIAVRMIDYFYTTEGGVTAQYGPPSKSLYWYYNDAGKPVLTNNGVNYSALVPGHTVPRYMSNEVLNFFTNEVKYKTKEETQAVAVEKELLKNYYGSLKPRMTYNAPLTAEERARENKEVSSSLTQKAFEWRYQFVYNVKNIDSDWSAYVNDITRLGAKTVEEDKQAADTRMQNWLKTH